MGSSEKGRLKSTANGHSHEGCEKKSPTGDDGLGSGTGGRRRRLGKSESGRERRRRVRS